jgi:hypothetical protein
MLDVATLGAWARAVRGWGYPGGCLWGSGSGVHSGCGSPRGCDLGRILFGRKDAAGLGGGLGVGGRVVELEQLLRDVLVIDAHDHHVEDVVLRNGVDCWRHEVAFLQDVAQGHNVVIEGFPGVAEPVVELLPVDPVVCVTLNVGLQLGKYGVGVLVLVVSHVQVL